MKVALLNNSQQFAGTERHMLDLAHALHDEGVDSTLVADNGSAIVPRAAASGLPIVSFRRRCPFSAVPVLRSMLQSGAVDLLHAHDGLSAMQCVLAAALAGRGACVKSQHFIEPAHLGRRGPKRWLSNAAHAWVNGRIDGCIAVSNAARRAMEARGDKPRGDVVVIPNGVAVPPPADLPPREQTRAALGVAESETFLLCLARLEYEKNVPALINAMRTVRSQAPHVRCLIAGTGSQMPALQDQIRSSGLAGAVELLGYRNDAFALLAAADLFVLPSFAEPFGLVLLEAMALSKPVVAVDQGGPSEIVVNGQTGLLSPSPDAPAIADALMRILADPQRWRRMGEAGRRRYEEHFTTQRMARATADFYRRVIGHARVVPFDTVPPPPATAGRVRGTPAGSPERI